MTIPYLIFPGKCKDVISFYEKVFNTKTKLCQLYGEYVPEGIINVPENLSQWVLHAEMEIAGTTFWLSDEAAAPVINGNNIRLSITLPTKKAADEVYRKLSEDADILLPPTATFYSTFHAGLIDRYGVNWNIVAEEAPNA